MMNRYHQAEFYVRAHNRHKLVDIILEAGIPLTIIGNKCHRSFRTSSKGLGGAAEQGPGSMEDHHPETLVLSPTNPQPQAGLWP